MQPSSIEETALNLFKNRIPPRENLLGIGIMMDVFKLLIDKNILTQKEVDDIVAKNVLEDARRP